MSVALTLLVLKTRQIDQLRAFYGALGIELAEEQHGKGPVHYAARLGSLVFEVYPLPEAAGAADATTRLGFQVSDLNAVIGAVRVCGAPVLHEPEMTEWGRRAVVRDPDGRAVELYQQ